jgi:hypothetical protein
MNSKKLYYILLAAVGVLFLGLLGGAYGANAVLQQQAKAVVNARSKSTALDQQQTQLITAKASIAKYQAVGKIAKSIVPTDKDQAQTVRELVKIAADNGIQLGALTFPSSTLGGVAGTTAPAAGAAASSGNSKLSQLKPAAGITGVYVLQINAQSDSSHPTTYNKFIEFLDDLEHNRRTALVSSVTLQPDAKQPDHVSFTLTLDEYLKP